MNLRPQRKEELELNITPLIDVVFLLLIFFMVSTTFERESEIKITLPKVSQEGGETQSQVVHVAIDANERIYIDERPLEDARLATLRAAIAASGQALEDPAVVIKADAGVSHEAVVRVMDAARQSGLVKITFATQVAED